MIEAGLKRPPPAYQEYASDMLASANYKMMSLEERGMLYTLRKECWVNSFVPVDVVDLAKYLGLEVIEVEKCLTWRVLSFFLVIRERLVCPELEAYKEMLVERHRKMAEGGKKGGKSTQRNHKETKACLEATLNPLSRDEMNRDEPR